MSSDVQSSRASLLSARRLGWSRLVRAAVRRIREQLAVLRAPRTTREQMGTVPLRRLLVVCYGNIYRSAFLAEYLRAAALPELEVRSAGVHPVPDRPSPERHVRMSALLGVDLRGHRSRVLQGDDIAWADAIVVMDRHNWTSVVEAGAPTEKILWAGVLAGDGKDVEIGDPYHLGDAEAKLVLERLVACGRVIERRIRGEAALSANFVSAQ